MMVIYIATSTQLNKVLSKVFSLNVWYEFDRIRHAIIETLHKNKKMYIPKQLRKELAVVYL